MNTEYKDLTSLIGKTIKEVSWAAPKPIDEFNLVTAPPQYYEVFIKFTDGFSIKFDMGDLGILDIQEPEGYNGPGMYETKLTADRVYDDGLHRGFGFTFDGKRREIENQLFRFQCESLEHAKSLLDLDQVAYVKWVPQYKLEQ